MKYIFGTADNRKWKYLLLCTFTYLKEKKNSSFSKRTKIKKFVAVVIRDRKRERFQKQNYIDTWNKTQKKNISLLWLVLLLLLLLWTIFVFFFLFSSVCSAVYCFVCLFWFSFSASITRLLTIWIQAYCMCFDVSPVSFYLNFNNLFPVFAGLHLFILCNFVSASLSHTIRTMVKRHRKWWQNEAQLHKNSIEWNPFGMEEICDNFLYVRKKWSNDFLFNNKLMWYDGECQWQYDIKFHKWNSFSWK